VYVPGKWVPLKEVYTGEDGAYRLDDLPAGPTQLIFDTCCRRYLPVTPTITLTVNTVTTGVDAQMQPWGVLKGRVTDEATGQPVAKAWVKLYRPVRDHWSLGTATVTGDDGSYAFYGLDSGTYRLEFAHPQGWYRSEAYPDAPNVAAGGDIAFVLEGDTEVDAALARQAAGVKVYVPLVAR
jgi:5-hydroxyisourate hydrolase-like protein (transthyretin family)